jgi:hypothetical protein
LGQICGLFIFVLFLEPKLDQKNEWRGLDGHPGFLQECFFLFLLKKEVTKHKKNCEQTETKFLIVLESQIDHKRRKRLQNQNRHEKLVGNDTLSTSLISQVRHKSTWNPHGFGIHKTSLLLFSEINSLFPLILSQYLPNIGKV